MAIVTVKNKYQVVIPQALRQEIGINVGDLLEAKAVHGQITFTPKTLVDSRIAESLADYKAGRSYGPFGTADEAIVFLKNQVKKRTGKKVKK